MTTLLTILVVVTVAALIYGIAHYWHNPVAEVSPRGPVVIEVRWSRADRTIRHHATQAPGQDVYTVLAHRRKARQAATEALGRDPESLGFRETVEIHQIL